MKLHKKNGKLTITLAGALTVAEVADDHAMLCSWLRKGDVRHIIVKPEGLTAMDTAGLQLLLAVAKMADSAKVSLQYQGQNREIDRLNAEFGMRVGE